MTTTKWGDCDWCHQPSKCGRYFVEVGECGWDVCEPCFFKWQDRLKKLAEEFQNSSDRNAVK